MISYRIAETKDWKSLAALHALSWQENYRGSMSDDYLDNKVVEDRMSVWEKRYENPAENMVSILAEEENDLLGFSCIYLNDDEKYGSLLDNLHVQPKLKRKGIGKSLMAKSAQLLLDKKTNTPLYLWVITRNANAIKFYKSVGGVQEDLKPWPMPDGGQVDTYRYVWYDIKKLSNLG